VQHDSGLFARRERGNRGFWDAFSVLGAGWPLVVATAGGALLGRWLHLHWNTGIFVTLALVVIGAVVGMVLVWRLIQPRSR
jgi:predicted F0F1-ATPase subunit